MWIFNVVILIIALLALIIANKAFTLARSVLEVIVEINKLNRITTDRLASHDGALMAALEEIKKLKLQVYANNNQN